MDDKPTLFGHCPRCQEELRAGDTWAHLGRCGVLSETGIDCLCGFKSEPINKTRSMVDHLETVPHDWAALAVMQELKKF